jgi:hypothetical protein
MDFPNIIFFLLQSYNGLLQEKPAKCSITTGCCKKNEAIVILHWVALGNFEAIVMLQWVAAKILEPL